MGNVALKARYTAEEYLAFERAATEKHEFEDGEVLAMSGGSPDHSRVAGNIFARLHLRLVGRVCQPYTSDLRIALASGRRYVYPDVSVICGPLEFDPADDLRHTVTNPKLIVEVLSPSTELYDRTRKFDAYQQVASLDEYVLASQDSPRVEVYGRQPNGEWTRRVHVGTEATAKLTAIDVDLPLAEIYAGIAFPAA